MAHSPTASDAVSLSELTFDDFTSLDCGDDQSDSPIASPTSPPVETPPPSGAPPLTMAAPTPRVGPLSLEEKQERQRMHVRRSYYKKRGYIRSLKEQVETLEKEYADALAAQPDKASLVAAAAAATPPPMAAVAMVSSPTMASEFLVPDLHDVAGSSPDVPASTEAMQVFMQLSSVRDFLRHENEELKKALLRYVNFVRRVNQSIEDAQTEADQDPVPHVDVLGFEISQAECQYITLRAYDEVKRFLESGECVSTGVSLFGWRDKRRIRDGYVEFSVKKFYNHRQAHALWEATYDLMSSASRLGALYSSRMSMTLRLVQRVDDDTVVYYRRMDRRHEPAGTVSKSIFLVTRLHTELGYLIMFRTCDSDRHRRERQLISQVAGLENEKWHDVFIWILFQEFGENAEHTHFSYGGRVDTSAAPPQVWMLEVLLLSLKWEANIIGPMFVLR